ncbi:septum site-determining protein MinC [Ramlibacter rhizophilus]|uniref:Probable septum site-determining protein MinC n=1 Tax=Ramlibacter rhizophilus TaxID=1781167 RepID=A0A4Z0BIL1_9BURK|nr:septum site-determining protein MinC [Ramlibacter rhizophilus]TFY97974.1 septum site-determining protein MinC [Ramlibacter rhizophilus]
MTVASAGRTPATFEIKSANLPLVCLLLKSDDLAALASELQARFGDTPDFFDHDPAVIELSPLRAAGIETAPDFAALIPLLHSLRLRPVAVRGGSAAQMAAAQAAGLAAAQDLVMPRERPARSEAPAPQAPAPAPAAEAAPTSALVIDRPLRSGQQVYARGRDLIVMCMVNPGAEVIADGHIHVYAPLRGKAIAGARGNVDARILSLCLEPELISIAGVYRTSDVPLPPEVQSRPTQVRLVGGTEGKLVMDAIT